MSSINQTATTELIVDGEQAKRELEVINDKISVVNSEIKKARKSGDDELLKSLKKQKLQLVENRKSLQKEAIEVNRILNNLSTAKPKELNDTIRSLTKQLNNPAVKRGSEQWVYLNQQIKNCKLQMKQLNSELQLGESRVNRFNGMFSKWSGIVTTATAAIVAIVLALNKFRSLATDQEESRYDLKALTGLDDESIDWLEKKAVELSTTVSESGVRIRQSAGEILEAYKLVGSAKPDLLANKEALNAVTEETLLLAAASGMKLTDAVDAVTLSLNQYGAGAAQASRYVNVLAAGSKVGAAAVESQTRAIKTAGVAASGAYIQIEELQGTIQTLAEKGIKNEVAGTGLRNFFLALQTGADETNPKMIGLTAALDELAKKQLTANELKKQFGEGGYDVAKILIDNRDKVISYTEAVTGTSVALEQAATKSESVEAAMDTARNKLNQAAVAFVKYLNPALLKASSLTTTFIDVLIQLPELFKLYWQWLVLATAVTVAYNAQLITNNALKLKQIIVTKAQTVAQTALNLALKANPIGLFVTLVGTLIASFITWYNHSIKVQAVTKGLWSSIKELYKNYITLMGGIRDVITGFFSGINYFLQGGRNISKGIDIIKDSFNKGTASIKKVVSGGAESVANAFWDTYNQTMKEGANESSPGDIVLPDGDDPTEIERRRQAEIEAAKQKAAEEAEKKRQEEAKKAAEKAEKERKKQLKSALDANKNLFTALKADTKQKFLEQQVSETEMYRILELLEMQSLESRLSILKRFGEDSSSEEERIIDMRIAALKKLKETEKLSYWLGSVDEEEADAGLEEMIELHKKSFDYQHASLLDQYNKGLITQREYQDAERELLQDHLEQMLSKRMQFAESVSQIANQAAQLVSTLSAREELAVENKYAAQLKAAKGNAEETAALEEQMEEEKKAVKKKYADIDFAITAAQIVASTAAGIMRLWVDPGGLAAIPLAALVGATGAAQLLMANEQRQQVKNLWTGGYTSSGPWDEPKGIVHSDEFVGNRFAVRNSAVNKVFRMVDIAQKNNTIASINESDIMRAVGVSPSYSSGQTVIANNSGLDGVAVVLDSVTSAIVELRQQLQEGTLARTYVTGDGGTKTARDKYDKMIKNVTRYTRK